MAGRVRSMRLLSISALPGLALEAAAIAIAVTASGPGAALIRAVSGAGAVILALAGGWWLTAPQPPGTRAARGRLAEAVARIADGRAWVTAGQVLRCQPSGPGAWELLVADRDQDVPPDLDVPPDQDAPWDLDAPWDPDELWDLDELRDPDELRDLDEPGPAKPVPVTFVAYSVSRRAVSRRTSAWLAQPGPRGALTAPPEPARSRRERAAAAFRMLQLARAGLLSADAAEIAGLTAMAASAVRYQPD
ncbi:MAG TPA: hypothetical protein VGH88_21915 [Streptosporangiaceae bacterium]